MNRILKSDELGVSPWFVIQDEVSKKWMVARNHDTVDKEFETGDVCYGMRTEVDSEHETEAEARVRLNRVRWIENNS